MLNTIDEKDKIKKIKNKEKIVLLTVSVPERLLKKFEEEADTKLWKKSTLMKVILEKRYRNNVEWQPFLGLFFGRHLCLVFDGG
ncbi:hypothetical protein [Spiroplasma ixodetis]|uniref:hypothetical protein n=1 Tax=Spiroplasma ixodetis TaxID=2141 RepID=UPI0025758668|nr:hypothetical protein [Spiroplasma ixodetis]WJG71402.1 hypothetical protein SIXOD_v1c28400 [Spiroplasma ixodetis Y32]